MFPSLCPSRPLVHPRILQVAGEPRGLQVTPRSHQAVPPATAEHTGSTLLISPRGAETLVVEWTGSARDQHRVALA